MPKIYSFPALALAMALTLGASGAFGATPDPVDEDFNPVIRQELRAIERHLRENYRGFQGSDGEIPIMISNITAFVERTQANETRYRLQRDPAGNIITDDRGTPMTEAEVQAVIAAVPPPASPVVHHDPIIAEALEMQRQAEARQAEIDAMSREVAARQVEMDRIDADAAARGNLDQLEADAMAAGAFAAHTAAEAACSRAGLELTRAEVRLSEADRTLDLSRRYISAFTNQTTVRTAAHIAEVERRIALARANIQPVHDAIADLNRIRAEALQTCRGSEQEARVASSSAGVLSLSNQALANIDYAISIAEETIRLARARL